MHFQNVQPLTFGAGRSRPGGSIVQDFECSQICRWSVAERKPELLSPTVLTPYSFQQALTKPFKSILYSKWQINHLKILPLGKCHISTQELTSFPFYTVLPLKWPIKYSKKKKKRKNQCHCYAEVLGEFPVDVLQEGFD